VPIPGSPPAAVAAPVLAADSETKRGSQALLFAVVEVHVHSLTAGPGT
jgi:hypothetical protein